MSRPNTIPEFQPTPEIDAIWPRLGQSHLFLTGKAGTGKSTLLQQFHALTSQQAVVLAFTGVAAQNAGGSTIHSFFRFPPGIQPARASRLRPEVPEIYEALKCMIIDEASMVRADLLDCIEAFLKRYGPQPGALFGGVKVLLVGDPYQLEPVATEEEAPLLKH